MSTKTMDVNAATGFAGFDTTSAVKEAFKMMKTSFDVSFTYGTKMQDLGEKMFRETAELGKIVQADGAKMVDLCVDNARKARSEQKKTVDEYFKKAEELY